jgi:CubicO group peptidase (beta-lactamase class C family)
MELSGRTVLPIGSVTKTFTALALADAVVSGQLGLDTPLPS